MCENCTKLEKRMALMANCIKNLTAVIKNDKRVAPWLKPGYVEIDEMQTKDVGC